MLPYKRSQRVSDLIREEVADILMYRMKDPRIGFVTVTGVDLSDDLKIARVFVSILKPDERERTMKVLNAAKPFIRSSLGKRLKMKFTPAVEFRLDTSIEYGYRIEMLLKKVREEDEGSESGS
ncbi:MAG: 30S ribosome-binding factor RbfA [Thermodesulfovibrionales bacterium]